MNLAADNFLIPNGTFFVVLIIFVILLLIIGKFVVPPIQQVLTEREEMINRTHEDNKRANAEFASADTEYEALLKDARGEATATRDEARAAGRAELNEVRQQATDAADATLAKTNAELAAQGEQAVTAVRSDVDSLARTLASRVLGVEPGSLPEAKSTTTTGVNN